MKAGWEVKPLGEVIEKLETVDPRKTPDIEFDYVDVSTVSKQTYKIEGTTRTLGANAPSRARRKIRTNDVIFATIRPTLQRIAFVPSELDDQICSTGYMVLRAKQLVLSKFIYYFLFSDAYSSAMEKLQKGASYPAVTDGEVRQQPIPLPPLDEQKRIVAVLDAAFDGLTRARAHAEANLQNARELFESGLEEAFERGRKIWPEHTVDDIGIVQTGSTPKTSDERNYGSFLPFIKPAHFNLDGSLTYNVEGLSEQGAAQSRLVSSNSVLMVCIGATIGKVGYSTRDVATNQQINSLSPKDGVLNKFIYFQMRSKSFQDSVLLKSGQATLPIINKSKWSSLGVFVPEDLQEQKDVSEKLDGLLAVSHEIADQYQQKIADIDNLRQSLLQKAFAGELT